MQRHFTASAFVIDSRKQVLLLWHHRLQRWMPPGGHVEKNELPEECAKRECKEETGLDVEILGEDQPDVFAENRSEGRMLTKPFVMLLEEIPAHEGMPGKPAQSAHQHMDFVFLARPKDEHQALVLAKDEAHELKWFTLKELLALSEKQIFANVRAYASALLQSD